MATNDPYMNELVIEEKILEFDRTQYKLPGIEFERGLKHFVALIKACLDDVLADYEQIEPIDYLKNQLPAEAREQLQRDFEEIHPLD